MNISNINELASISWCPVEEHTNLMVTGTLAGTVQLDFASSATLMIYETQNNGAKKVIGAVETPDKFYKLTWGKHNNASYGLIAGTMLNGTIGVWNPQIIIDEYAAAKQEGDENVQAISHEQSKALVTKFEGHDGGEVQALEFNNMEPGLLVSGGSDSKLNFYDLRNINKPTTMDFAQRTPHTGQNVVGVSWNKGFAEVLASCSMEGLCVIWDVKNKRHLVTFSSDQQKRKYKCVDWNPKNPTFVALASCDDENPVIEIWNLQVPNQPMKTLTGHDKGIMSLMWCPYDHNLLVSGGKDGRTILWNPNSGEKLGELPRAGNWVYDVQWSLKTSILSVASYDKHIAIYSIQDATIGNNGSSEKRFETAPQWLSRPVGAIFGFGGLLVSINNGERKSIQLDRVKSDSTLPERASNLFSALKNDSHGAYIEEKKEEAQGDCTHQATIWELMSILTDTENKNDRLFELLGFDKDAVAEKAADEGLVERATAQSDIPEALSSDEITAILRECVITANWSSAVDLCFKCSMFADALIFARKGSQELYEATQDRYLQTQGNPAIAMVQSISNSLMDFVDQSELSDWKSTLAILCTYAKGEFISLCERLGRRLEEAESNLQAAICYMCADCYGNVLNIWVKEYLHRLHDGTKRVSPDEAAFPLLEKFLIYQKTVKQKFSVTGSLKSAFIMLTVDLTTQGHFEDALWLSSLVEDSDINMLKHRLYHSVNELEGKSKQEKPSTPWGKQTTDFSKAVSNLERQRVQERRETLPNGSRVAVNPRLNTNAYINNTNKQYMTSTPSGAVANYGITSNLVNPNLYASQHHQQQPQQQQQSQQPQQQMMQPYPTTQQQAFQPPANNYVPSFQAGPSSNPTTNFQQQQPQQGGQPTNPPPAGASSMMPPQPTMTDPSQNAIPSGTPLVSGQGVQSSIVPPMKTKSVTSSPSSTVSSSSRSTTHRTQHQVSIHDLDFTNLPSSDESNLCSQLYDIINGAYGEDISQLKKADERRYEYVSKALVAIYDQFTLGNMSDTVRDHLKHLLDMLQSKNFKEFSSVHRELTSNHNNESKAWAKGLKFLKQSLQ